VDTISDRDREVPLDWDELRRAEFPVARQWAYFDHAAVSPLPRRSGAALRAWIDEQEANGCVHWPGWARKVEDFRDDLARLIGADADEIAFVSSTTHGIGVVAEGFPWRDGDSVVTVEEEYPSNIVPWLNLAARGVALRAVPDRGGRVVLDDLAAAIDDRTRVVTISHVEWASGFRNDLDALAELCHGRGAALFVDAIQSLPALTLDVRRTPIDFLAAGGQKWLLGPEGTGFLFVRRDWIERLRPVLVGSHSVQTSYNVPGIHFDLKPSARRWEGGAFNMPGIQALGTSVGLFLELGAEAVSARILDRAESVRDRARRSGWTVYGPADPREQSGIVALERPDADPDGFVRRARERGIALSARRGRLRISPHVYNDEEDLRRLEDALLDRG
jgi:selenocysteine lyase/cysteine desulfurase